MQTLAICTQEWNMFRDITEIVFVWMKGNLSLYSFSTLLRAIRQCRISCFSNSCLLNHDGPNTGTRWIVRNAFRLNCILYSGGMGISCSHLKLSISQFSSCSVLYLAINVFWLFSFFFLFSMFFLASIPHPQNHSCPRAQTFHVSFSVTFMSGTL